MSKLILFLEKSYGDDLGRGKSLVSKYRHRKMIKTRLRKFVKQLGI